MMRHGVHIHTLARVLGLCSLLSRWGSSAHFSTGKPLEVCGALRETLPRSPRHSSFSHRTLTRGTLLPPCLLKLAQSLSKGQVGRRRDECGRRRLSASPLRITNFPCAALTHDVARERGRRGQRNPRDTLFLWIIKGGSAACQTSCPWSARLCKSRGCRPPRAILGKSSRRHDLARRVGVPRVIKPGCHRGVLHEWE